MITFATGCSGIGAPEVAWGDRLGWKCLWCSEIEPFPSAVLAYRWPDVPNVGDFLTIAKRVDADELEAPDVFCAGTPCQAFSVAGLRQSLDDPRGGLTLEFIRIANAFDRQRRRRGLPETILLWENVPGVFSAKDNPFGCFLAGLLGLDAPVIPQNGKWRNYGDLVAKRRVAWRTLDAQYFDVAQRRKRVFLIATTRPGFRPARGLFECGSVPRTAPPSRKVWARTAADAQVDTGTTNAIRMRAGKEGGGKGALIGREISHTLQTGNDQVVVHFGIGNGQVAEACDMQEEVSQTLTCMHDRQAVMHVCYTKTAHPHNLDEGQGFVQTDLAKTLNCHSVPSSELRAEELVLETVAVENHGQDSRLKEVGDCAPTIPSQAGTGGNNVPLIRSSGYVRRLTTVECARLQGFPDHHAEIPWKGKPAELCPKGPQYKAYGNAMCVNVIEWLGKVIEGELKR